MPPTDLRPGETLLVVDDDLAVCSILTRALSTYGYRVLPANGAEEALRLEIATPKIDLLITDYAMPQVNGLELIRQFRSGRPHTPVLLISGSLPPLDVGAEAYGRFATLAKPFSLAELIGKVRELLDAAADASDRTTAMFGESHKEPAR